MYLRNGGRIDLPIYWLNVSQHSCSTNAIDDITAGAIGTSKATALYIAKNTWTVKTGVCYKETGVCTIFDRCALRPLSVNLGRHDLRCKLVIRCSEQVSH